MSRSPTTASLAILFPYHSSTGDIIVRVAVSYLADQSDPSAGRWFWSYHIRIENGGHDSVQLMAREWLITDGRGAVQLVSGEGVVGEMPVIAPGESFDYVSGCPLPTATGSMNGSYSMLKEDGDWFDVAIPSFALVGPAA
jgi:ApaG protein